MAVAALKNVVGGASSSSDALWVHYNVFISGASSECLCLYYIAFISGSSKSGVRERRMRMVVSSYSNTPAMAFYF